MDSRKSLIWADCWGKSVMGGKVTEKAPERAVASASGFVVSEEDVKLVADQTGKSIEEARKALEECEGDLAKAILLLQS